MLQVGEQLVTREVSKLISPSQHVSVVWKTAVKCNNLQIYICSLYLQVGDVDDDDDDVPDLVENFDEASKNEATNIKTAEIEDVDDAANAADDEDDEESAPSKGNHMGINIWILGGQVKFKHKVNFILYLLHTYSHSYLTVITYH